MHGCSGCVWRHARAVKASELRTAGKRRANCQISCGTPALCVSILGVSMRCSCICGISLHEDASGQKDMHIDGMEFENFFFSFGQALSYGIPSLTGKWKELPFLRACRRCCKWGLIFVAVGRVLRL